jgi:hypothetical protein
MVDQKTEPLEPVAVTVVDTGHAPDVTLKTGTVAATPGTQTPNLIVTVVGPARAILVRFVNQFLTTLVGLVGAAMTPAGAAVLPATDFYHLVLNCAALSVAGAGFGALKDLVTIFGRLESKYPLLTGSV